MGNCRKKTKTKQKFKINQFLISGNIYGTKMQDNESPLTLVSYFLTNSDHEDDRKSHNGGAQNLCRRKSSVYRRKNWKES